MARPDNTINPDSSGTYVYTIGDTEYGTEIQFDDTMENQKGYDAGGNQTVYMWLPPARELFPPSSDSDDPINIAVNDDLSTDTHTCYEVNQIFPEGGVENGGGILINPMPDALPGDIVYIRTTPSVPQQIKERFSEGSYDENWLDLTENPEDFGDVFFEGEDLKITWEDVPFAFEKRMPADDSFGDYGSKDNPSYFRDVTIHLGAVGELSQDLTEPFPEGSGRVGEWVPDVVYFGIFAQGLSERKCIFVIIAHTELDTNFINGQVISGPNKDVVMILPNSEAASIDLSGYNEFLGGGIMQMNMSGPAGIDKTGDFNPTVFKNTSPPLVAFDVLELSYSGNSHTIYDATEYQRVDRFELNNAVTKLYFYVGTYLYQTEITTAEDISTASQITENISLLDLGLTAIRAFCFKDDETVLYHLAKPFGKTASLSQFNLGVPGDITSITGGDVEHETGLDTAFDDLFFKPDGTRVFFIQVYYNYDTYAYEEVIYELPLSTPWDVTTVGSPVVYNTGGSEGSSLNFNPSGTKLFIYGRGDNGATVREYGINTAWDLSSGLTGPATFTFVGPEVEIYSGPSSSAFNSDGSKFYVLNQEIDTIYQYNEG